MKKYKIAVLTDLGSAAKATLKSAISLAKMIDGEIELFNVKKPTEIIDKDNQLSAMRLINTQITSTDKQMKAFVNAVASDYGVTVGYSFSFGNIKNEISKFIEEKNPDIIVLGKKKSAPLKFFGDGIIKYICETFKGAILIATDSKSLEPNKEISMGLFNNLEPSFNLKFADDLMSNVRKPLKSFKIVKNSGSKEAPPYANENIVEYVFEQNDNSVKNLSNYLAKNKVDLLYLDRMENDSHSNMKLAKTDIATLANQLDVTLLVTAV